MKELRGQAAASVAASRPDCFKLLAAIDRYPEWHPEVVRSAEVTERDGQGLPIRARTVVHLGLGPLRQDFPLRMQIQAIPEQMVSLARLADGPADPERLVIRWEIHSGPRTRLAIELEARLDVPRLLPIRGLGDSVAQAFLAAAEAQLRRGVL